MRISFFHFLLLIIVFPLLGTAEPTVVSQVQQDNALKIEILKSYKRIFELLVNSGVSSVGALRLSSLFEDLQQVNYKVIKNPLVTQGRIGHRYEFATKTVYVASDLIDGGYGFGSGIILLHESLGAAGYSDEKYEISSVLLSMVALFADPEISVQNKLNLSVKAGSFNFREVKSGDLTKDFGIGSVKKDFHGYLNPQGDIEFALGGGVSEGGGGGDPNGLTYKFVILYSLIKENVPILKINNFVNNFTIESYLIKDGSVAQHCDPLDKSFQKFTYLLKIKNYSRVYMQQMCRSNAAYFEFLYRLIRKNL